MKARALFILLAACIAMSACSKKQESGNLQVKISYSVDNQELEVDTLRYINQAGNHYLVNEIQWFVSDICLIDDEGKTVTFNTSRSIFYIDSDLPETETLHSTDIPEGHYKAVHFTLGMNDAENQSGRFVNPPESDMFWPEPMGGGYHHIKLNGKWMNTNNELLPFCMHIGKGPDGGNFISNYFEVETSADISVKGKETTSIVLNMNINNWFCNPNTYDFNYWGGSIMSNQSAQATLKQNGHNVFTIQ